MDRIDTTFRNFLEILGKKRSDPEAIEGIKSDLHSIKGLFDMVGLNVSAQSIAELEDNVHGAGLKLDTELISMLRNTHEKLTSLVKMIQNRKPKTEEVSELDQSAGFEAIFVTFGKLYNVELKIDAEESLKTARALSLYNYIKRFANIKSANPDETDLYMDIKFDLIKLEIFSREDLDYLITQIGQFPNVTNVSVREEIVQETQEDLVSDQDLTLRISLSYIRALEESLTTLSYHLDAIRNEITSSKGIGELNGISKVMENMRSDLRVIRKVPLDSIIAAFPSMTARLAEQEGKDVELLLQGRFMTLDRSLANYLIDPLTQLIRNSISHGIELPSDREKKGKASKGTIFLNAVSERDQIYLEITDDGQGLDRAKILESLSGLDIDTDEFKNKRAEELIFLKGLTTGDRSKISGRGLGLFTARDRINQIGGSITVESKKDEGTTFRITLADTDSLSKVIVFEIEGQEYAVASTSVEEILIYNKSILEQKDGYYGTILYKEKELPVSILKSLLVPNSEIDSRVSSNHNNEGVIIICKGTSSLVGLMVDSITGERLTSIKSLNKLLFGYNLYKGTILGRNKAIILVINPEELI